MSSPPPSFTPSEHPPVIPGLTSEFAFARLVRERLDRETDLIIQRTAWVVGSQAFLFSAYAISLNSPAHTVQEHSAKLKLLMLLIPWVSLISLALLLVTVCAGVVALQRLRRHASQADPLAQILLEEGPAVRMASLAGPLLVPLAFLATWLALLFLNA